MDRPNVIFVFGDQWRAQAVGYAGNPQVRTPVIDALAAESISFSNAVAGCPVCSPYRASFLTGQYPLTHGVFVNDVPLDPAAHSIAKSFAAAGYDTAYVGKWHVDGHGRAAYIPEARHQGFQYWKVLECTHDYNNSPYFAQDSDEELTWEGYDAIAQTRDASEYIRAHDATKPFFLALSWGPPHAPYHTAPEKYRAMYDPAEIELRPNVPEDLAERSRKEIAGYYAHCTALDDCMGELRKTLRECGIEDDTILVFTSDHGDMLGSQGAHKKQQPWEESIRVPFLLSWPRTLGRAPKELAAPIDAPDIMPTLLGLAGVPIPQSAQGLDYSSYLRGGDDPSNGAALIMCPHPFGQWTRKHGGREYRGVRTARHTYAKTLDGPWLLFDNEADPYQQRNLVDDPAYASLRDELDGKTNALLERAGDDFQHSTRYIERWGYELDANGTVPYSKKCGAGNKKAPPLR
jgi:arylsulfatase A-like enzyme